MVGRARKIEFQHGCSYKTLCVQTAWDLLVLGTRGGMNAAMLSWRSGSGVTRSFPQPFKISLFLGGWGKHETCKAIAIVDARAVADSARRRAMGHGGTGCQYLSRHRWSQAVGAESATAGNTDCPRNLRSAHLDDDHLPGDFRGRVWRHVLFDLQAPQVRGPQTGHFPRKHHRRDRLDRRAFPDRYR